MLERKIEKRELITVFGQTGFMYKERFIIINDKKVRETGNAFACIFKTGQIVVDYDFVTVLPIECQNFLLEHEIGHETNGDLEKMTPFTIVKRALISSLGGVFYQERNADKEAVKNTNKEIAIETLNIVFEHMQEKYKYDNKEILRRIKLIKTMH